MRIRDAVAEDAAAICELVGQLAEPGDPPPEGTEAYVRSALGHPAFTVLVAEEEGRVAGFLSYALRPSLYHGAEAGYVEELAVAPRWRGRGFGAALLSACLERLRARGCAEAGIGVLPRNEGAQRLYRRMGFVEEVLLLEQHFPRA